MRIEHYRYYEATADYKTAIDQFNAEAKRFNALVTSLKAYGLVDNDNSIEYLNYNSDSNNSTEINESMIETVSGETDSINGDTITINEKYKSLGKDVLTNLVNEYNDIAAKYNEAVDLVVTEYIEGIPTSIVPKDIKDYDTSEDISIDQIESLINEFERLSADYTIINQIYAPEESWVISRLHTLDSISNAAGVTQANDPNGLLGVEGGYKSCIYFSLRAFVMMDMDHASIIEMGTDAGGAIEVFPTKEAAINRCAYLSQFDDTILYSGSYTVVGTMVIRTSYNLSDENQVKLTNDLVTLFTTIE